MPHEPADATAEGQTCNTRGGDNATGRRQAEGLRLVVEFAPCDARLGAGGVAFRIDTDAFHGRQVDHQPAVAEGTARDVVTAATNRYQNVIGSSEIDRIDNVGDTGAAGDEDGSFVDHRIKTCACLVVSVVARTQQVTTQSRTEFLDHRCVERTAVSRCGHNFDVGHNRPPRF